MTRREWSPAAAACPGCANAPCLAQRTTHTMAEEGVPPVEQIATELEESKVELEFVEEFWKELKVRTR
jgi:hypothetical protein